MRASSTPAVDKGASASGTVPWVSFSPSLLAVAAVFILRRRSPEAPRPYRTLGYPVTPALFLLASLGMVANAFITDPKGTGATFGIIGAGIPVYFLWRAFQRR